MIDKWLNYKERTPSPYTYFRVIDVSENKNPDKDIMDYLGEQVLSAYRNLDFLKLQFESESEAELRKYVENYIFPDTTDQLGKNVRQGDFGEILASLIVSYFQKLTIPIQKLKWKFNSNKSVFCTDMIAHNSGKDIEEIYYYEIKSRLGNKKETVGGENHHVTIHAHNSLLRDEQNPNEGIADFLSRYYFEKDDFDNAKKYGDIVKSPKNYKKNFELFFIIEKKEFIEEILKDLNQLPPTLKPLGVTVVLIENLKVLVVETQKYATEKAVEYVRK
jgi:hypothetical protein